MASEENDKLVYLGYVSKAHGLKGHVRLVLSDSNEWSFDFDKLVLQSNQINRSLIIEETFFIGQKIAVKLEGVNDRTAADALRGSKVFIYEGVLLDELAEGEFYYYQLKGFQVVDMQGDSLGTVKEVQIYPHQDLLVILNAGREQLVPFVEQFIEEVDLIKKRIVICPIEGLLE